MGWTGIRVAKTDKPLELLKRELEQTRRPGEKSGWGFEYAVMRGTKLYGIMWHESMDVGAKRTYFGVVVLTKTRSINEWSNEFIYKEMTEDMEPYYYDAPKKMLDMLDALAPAVEGSHAHQWRSKCRARHMQGKCTNQPAAGMRVEYGGMHYTLVESAGPRRGWHVRTDKGVFYRMTAKQIGQVMQRQPADPAPKFTKEVSPEQFFREHFQVIHVGGPAA